MYAQKRKKENECTSEAGYMQCTWWMKSSQPIICKCHFILQEPRIKPSSKFWIGVAVIGSVFKCLKNCLCTRKRHFKHLKSHTFIYHSRPSTRLPFSWLSSMTNNSFKITCKHQQPICCCSFEVFKHVTNPIKN